MRISDWSSDVCSSDLEGRLRARPENMAVLGGLDREFVAMRRRRSRIESRIEGAGFLEVRAPARKGKQRIEFQPFASPAQNLRQQLPFQKRATHRFGVGFGQRRPSDHQRSEEQTSELQSLMRHSYAVFCLKT